MHDFQKQVLAKIVAKKSGLLIAPTGSGKTLAVALPHLAEIALYGLEKQLTLIWVTPLRSLASDICLAINNAADLLDIPFCAALRNGDTTTLERQKQIKNPPNALITTPESMHLLFAQKNNRQFLKNVKLLVVDEWHELLGSKRGVQTELVVSQLLIYNPALVTWGITATIGNIAQAGSVLLQSYPDWCIVEGKLDKKIIFKSIMPDSISNYPWAGHLGLTLLDKIIPVLELSKSTLVFTNTRSQTEIWYQNILAYRPDWAGKIAMHHSSLDRNVRLWVEDNLHSGKLKLVVCTSSLDLGVDFAPVDTVIQIGSPKGVARLLQRAGRSGHQPGKESVIYFLPTHALELLEAVALQIAIKNKSIEEKLPLVRSFDVLIQFLITLAVGDGFKEKLLFKQIKKTFSYSTITQNEWEWMLSFIVYGGKSLSSYPEFNKVSVANNLYKVEKRKVAMQHRMSIGTIESDAAISVKMLNGKYLGNMEEYFISKLKVGDPFVFSGKILEFVKMADNAAIVKNSVKKNAIVPAWAGGRMSFSNQISYWLSHLLNNLQAYNYAELDLLTPLLDLQQMRSELPTRRGLLIEKMESKEGYHLFAYPMAGRTLHEGIAMLMAYRLSKQGNASYSIAMNDYGFELLSDTPIPIEEAIEKYDLFSPDNLYDDMCNANNYSQMASKKFSNIANVAGIIFKGTPNKPIKNKHLRANSNLFYKVFRQYDADNLLLRQADEEVIHQHLEHHRVVAIFEQIAEGKIFITNIDGITPFCFPIMVDRFREQLSTEQLADRIKKMIDQAEFK